MLAEEKETIINWTDADDFAVVYSCHRRIWTRLEKLGIKPVRVSKSRNGRVDGKEYHVPKKWIKISRPRRMSEEQKLRSKELMKRLWKDGKFK